MQEETRRVRAVTMHRANAARKRRASPSGNTSELWQFVHSGIERAASATPCQHPHAKALSVRAWSNRLAPARPRRISCINRLDRLANVLFKTVRGSNDLHQLVLRCKMLRRPWSARRRTSACEDGRIVRGMACQCSVSASLSRPAPRSSLPPASACKQCARPLTPPCASVAAGCCPLQTDRNGAPIWRPCWPNTPPPGQPTRRHQLKASPSQPSEITRASRPSSGPGHRARRVRGPGLSSFLPSLPSRHPHLLHSTPMPHGMDASLCSPRTRRQV